MIYVTGDTHGDFKRFSKKNYGTILNENDIVIILGDMGLLWSKDKEYDYWCKFFKEKPWLTLFIDGNHENFNMLEEYPIEVWNGGKVRQIVKDKVLHLERGQVFTIENKTFFTMGGASSKDIEGGILDREDELFKFKKKDLKRKHLNFRILNESWWKQELPNEKELEEGIFNLQKNNNQIDYILTHCTSNYIQQKIKELYSYKKMNEDILTNYFDKLEDTIIYKEWYFGHYHEDIKIDDKHILCYKNLIPLI